MERVIKIEDKACEICNSNNLESLWSNESRIVRYSGTWVFLVHIAICKVCGFAFQSPSITKQDLEEYHAEGFSGCKDIGLAYDIDTRISFLKKYSSPNGTLVEIGGDRPDFFHDKCKDLFNEMISVDIASDIKADIKDHGDLPNNSVDMITHYDVLEHVMDSRDFLTRCFNILKPGGLMICEMPDIHLYPKNLVLLEAEHVNHFSVKTLSNLCAQIGFDLLESSSVSSRPHGFTAVFKKHTTFITDNNNFEDKNEVAQAIKSIKGGIAQVTHLKNNINMVKDKINNHILNKEKITIWAVTEVSRMLIDELPNSEFIKIVDSDSRRKEDLIKSNNYYVYEPDNSLPHIRDSSYIVIAAPRYAKEIIGWIKDNTDKEFESGFIDMLATDGNGQPLT